MSRAHHQVRIIRIFHHPVMLMYGAEARGNDDIRGGTDDGPLDYACVNKRDLGYYVPQLSDMATVSKIVDEPIEDVVWYVHWQDLLHQCAVPDSVKGTGEVHGNQYHSTVPVHSPLQRRGY